MADAIEADLAVKPDQDDDGLAPTPEADEISVEFNSSEDIDPNDLLVDDDFEEGGEEDKEDDFSFGKHWKNQFYLLCPNPAWNKVKIGTIKLKNSTDIWVVAGKLCRGLEQHGLTYCRIYTLQDNEGDIRFAPYRITRNGEVNDTWSDSAHDIFKDESRTTDWFKITSMKKGNRYQARKAHDQNAYGKVEWPDGDFMTLLMESCKQRFINNKDHDIYRAIIGQKLKK